MTVKHEVRSKKVGDTKDFNYALQLMLSYSETTFDELKAQCVGKNLVDLDSGILAGKPNKVPLQQQPQAAY